MRFAISVDNQTLGEVMIVPTPENISDVVGEFKKVADKLLDNKVPAAVVGGITRKKIAAVEEIKKMFGCPVFLENDAALAGLGESGFWRRSRQRSRCLYYSEHWCGGTRIVGGQN